MRDHPFSRRRFLALGAALSVAGPAACAPRDAQQPDLDDFLDLSALLTGFARADLDTSLARTYHDAIARALPAGFTLETLYQDAGLRAKSPPRTYDEIESHAKLALEPARSVVEAIMSCWYSGTIQGLGSQAVRVATYDQALAWKAIGWTTPNMECRGVTGFWSDPPTTGTV